MEQPTGVAFGGGEASRAAAAPGRPSFLHSPLRSVSADSSGSRSLLGLGSSSASTSAYSTTSSWERVPLSWEHRTSLKDQGGVLGHITRHTAEKAKALCTPEHLVALYDECYDAQKKRIDEAWAARCKLPRLVPQQRQHQEEKEVQGGEQGLVAETDVIPCARTPCPTKDAAECLTGLLELDQCGEAQESEHGHREDVTHEMVPAPRESFASCLSVSPASTRTGNTPDETTISLVVMSDGGHCSKAKSPREDRCQELGELEEEGGVGQGDYPQYLGDTPPPRETTGTKSVDGIEFFSLRDDNSITPMRNHEEASSPSERGYSGQKPTSAGTTQAMSPSDTRVPFGFLSPNKNDNSGATFAELSSPCSGRAHVSASAEAAFLDVHETIFVTSPL